MAEQSGDLGFLAELIKPFMDKITGFLGPVLSSFGLNGEQQGGVMNALLGLFGLGSAEKAQEGTDTDGNTKTNELEEEAVIALDTVADKLPEHLQTRVNSLIDKIESGDLDLAKTFQNTASRGTKDLSDSSDLAKAVESAFNMRDGNEERIAGKIAALAVEAETMEAPAEQVADNSGTTIAPAPGAN